MFSFEIRGRDLLGRIGIVETKNGKIETPVFLPVINPAKQIIKAEDMSANFGCNAIITNAYITRKQFGDEAVQKGIHEILNFPGVIITDSGAYQILAYGKVDITPEEIVRYQEQIDTDVATILDLPTGWKVSREHAQFTVEETLKRAKSLESLKTREDIAWVGPIQGGRYLDLVAESARETAKLPFHIHALGSPTPIMEQYLFDLLVDMILTAKKNLPFERPLHLFGAGHPFMFSFAVALGCDLFDSAAYSIYAKQGRYLTEYGTFKLRNLEYFPCSCPVCAKSSPNDLKKAPKEEQEKKLTEHNLYVCFSEMRRIKQAIIEGRLWEHLEMRAHGHPALLQALKRLRRYANFLEEFTPVTKSSGIFFFGSADLARPEIIRYKERLFDRYSPSGMPEVLLLLSSSLIRKFQGVRRSMMFLDKICKEINERVNDVHVCTFSLPFGIIPIELKDIYPLSQHEVTLPPDFEMIDHTIQVIVKYIGSIDVKKIVLFIKSNTWEEKIAEACYQFCVKKNIMFEKNNIP